MDRLIGLLGDQTEHCTRAQEPYKIEECASGELSFLLLRAKRNKQSPQIRKDHLICPHFALWKSAAFT